MRTTTPTTEAGENFPVALRVLPARVRDELHATYRYARYVDDLGDEYAGDRVAALGEVAQQVHHLYAGAAVTDPVVAGMTPLVTRAGVPEHCLLRLVEANLRDQGVARCQDFAELLDYCRLSADPVGEIVLTIFAKATPDRIELSDRICTALQLLEHWQDIGEDHARGRVYLPKEDLDRFAVSEDDLGAEHASVPLRRLVAFETERAAAWLGSGAPLVSTLRGWARLAVSGYVAGGRAAAARIRRAGYDTLTGDVKPTRSDIAAAWADGWLRRAG
ncbi:MAG: squalene synthase HpnC [Intrasporangium sp.]|uniref:squalene synthase HpnC n=1 Tax=Intrasporangium sp. TaxID=1925024 RepID=UPI0026493AF3|nr:squalene synthase HpnC [Intrasporangium sp.]MDN5797428.1 squalene synthase HpnC [Intrasporangium sp.]